MNTRQPQIERVAFTEAEVEHLAPILERYETAQREFQSAQRDIDAVIKLYRAQHKAEMTDGPEWQVARDCFLRQLPPAQFATMQGPDDELRSGQPDEVNGSVEEEVSQLLGTDA